MRVTMFIKGKDYEIAVTDHYRDEETVNTPFSCLDISNHKNEICLHFDSLETMKELLNLALIRINCYLDDAE